MLTQAKVVRAIFFIERGFLWLFANDLQYNRCPRKPYPRANARTLSASGMTL